MLAEFDAGAVVVAVELSVPLTVDDTVIEGVGRVDPVPELDPVVVSVTVAVTDMELEGENEALGDCEVDAEGVVEPDIDIVAELVGLAEGVAVFVVEEDKEVVGEGEGVALAVAVCVGIGEEEIPEEETNGEKVGLSETEEVGVGEPSGVREEVRVREAVVVEVAVHVLLGEYEILGVEVGEREEEALGVVDGACVEP